LENFEKGVRKKKGKYMEPRLKVGEHDGREK
jgi:hypothetical protein